MWHSMASGMASAEVASQLALQEHSSDGISASGSSSSALSGKGSMVHCHCDNMVVVLALNAGGAKLPKINRPLRCQFFFTAHLNFQLK